MTAFYKKFDGFSTFKMGKSWRKFTLLMWKNWILQKRHPIQTTVEILAPVLLASLLVLIRSLVEPTHVDTITKFYPFDPEGTTGTLFSDISSQKKFMPIAKDLAFTQKKIKRMRKKDIKPLLPPGYFMKRANWDIACSPNTTLINSIMDDVIVRLHKSSVENITFTKRVYDNQTIMLNELVKPVARGRTLLGIAFEDSIAKTNKFPSDIKITYKFPSELRLVGNDSDWRTNTRFPMYQSPGPREQQFNSGGLPSYWYEGFLLLEHHIFHSIFDYLNENGTSITLPRIQLQRFPYPTYTQDDMLDALKKNVPLLMMVSFVYTCISIVKVVTLEKERQLKESMKIMGLPNWLHWTAWFLKSLIFLMITVILIVILLKIPWYPDTDLAVFSNSDPSLLLIFYLCYMVASICFCFMVSSFFNRANLASLLAGMLWFLSYLPYMFMSEHYEDLTQAVKVSTSLCSNTAMAYGFQLFLMAEGTGEGMQWKNIWKPVTKDDHFVLGHVVLMLIADAFIYLIITLYIEAVFPGEYGVPEKWYFPLQKSYWCRRRDSPNLNVDMESPIEGNDIYEAEPKNLPAGIQIKHLTKAFKNKVAVKNLSLNMYEGQITVLLGHNGAGKTTTMSMLTGMFTPTRGTALVGGYDVGTDIHKVRESLGFCPQHNILFDELTVREHLYFFSKLKGLTGNSLDKEIRKYIKVLDLEAKENSQSSTLSGGMKRKLAAGVALCGGSKVVLFDEPTSGLDPAARRAMWEILQAEKDGRTVLLSTHFMDEADLLGDRIAIMAGGELQCCGSSFFLKKKYGAGYHLIIVKGSNCDVKAVTGLLREFIADIRVDQNIGSELSYILSEGHSSIFEAMLSKLENNQLQLGLHSYGISLTTMEEVFMKIGRDAELSTSEGTFMNGIDNIVYSGSVEIEDSSILPNETKCISTYFKRLYTNPGSYGNYIVSAPDNAIMTGVGLLYNQLIAMFMKKMIFVWRTWYVTLVQIVLPTFCLIIAITAVRSWLTLTELRAMVIDLQGYGETFTPIVLEGEPDNITENYKSMTGGFYVTTENMSHYIERKSIEDLQEIRQNNIVGVTFGLNETEKVITGWFNNLPYHSVPLTIGLIHNSLLKHYLGKTITMVNHPLPYSDDTKVGFQAWTGNILGFQVGFTLGFSMAFVTAFFIIFYIKERECKAKHLQAVSGVNVLTFWGSAFIWDMFLFLVPSLAVVITFMIFQEDGFKTSSELGRVFLVLACFGWSVLPATYLCSFLFKIPLTGFSRMTMVNLVIGVAAYLTVTIMKIPSLKLSHVAKVLDWIFIFCPHYSFCSSIHSLYSNYFNAKTCRLALLLDPRCSKPSVCCKNNCHPDNGCIEWSNNYFSWEVPGIGRNILFFILDGVLCIIILVLVEYRVFERFSYCLQKRKGKQLDNEEVADETDSDVMDEKIKIHTTPTSHLLEEYDLVLKDVTKYYGHFLAVDKLCLAIKKGECFGLLGVNGAGKTTTFKMMTGDVKLSSGEGYVCGLDLKTQMKHVHQQIGYCPQFDAILEEMTGKETLTMFCLLRGIPMKHSVAIIEQLTDELLLKKHINKKIKEYSGGNKRKLSTAISLIGDPPIVYLDEPTTGMDPVAKRHLWNVICKIRDSGKCIVLTSHSMEECEALCTRLAIMVNGKFRCLGSTQHLKNKFAKGYTLIIKVKKAEKRLSESFTASSQSIVSRDDLYPIKAFIEQSFPGSILVEEYQGLLTYSISNPTIKWSKMFGIMEKAKLQLNIEDYSLGQTSLEQVFLTFTKKQRED